MTTFTPVEYDPFGSSADISNETPAIEPRLTPVDHDPFAVQDEAQTGPKVTPVEHDPFISEEDDYLDSISTSPGIPAAGGHPEKVSSLRLGVEQAKAGVSRGGTFLAEESKEIQKEPSIFENIFSQTPGMTELADALKADRPKNAEQAQQLSNRLRKITSDIENKLATDPEFQSRVDPTKSKFSPGNIITKVQEAAPLTIAAMGTGLLASIGTKNPITGALLSGSMFGAVSAGGTMTEYEEAVIKQAKEQGRDPEKALNNARASIQEAAQLAGTGEAALEFLPGMMFMKMAGVMGKGVTKEVTREAILSLKFMSKKARDIGKLSLAEGAEEAMQTFKDNAIAKWNFDPDRDLLEDVPESAVIGGVTGGILGGGAVSIDTAKQLGAGETALTPVDHNPFIDEATGTAMREGAVRQGERIEGAREAERVDKFEGQPLTDEAQEALVADVLRKNPNMTLKQARETVENSSQDMLKRVQAEKEAARTEKENVRISELESNIRDLKAKFDATRLDVPRGSIPATPSKDVAKQEIAPESATDAIIAQTEDLTNESRIGNITLGEAVQRLSEGDKSVLPDILKGVEEHGGPTMQHNINNAMVSEAYKKQVKGMSYEDAINPYMAIRDEVDQVLRGEKAKERVIDLEGAEAVSDHVKLSPEAKERISSAAKVADDAGEHLGKIDKKLADVRQEIDKKKPITKEVKKKPLTKADFTKKIKQAVTETDTTPTEAQKEAGNYKKGSISIQGLDISIENPKGSTRSGKDSDGETWETKMKSHYGYIKGTVGKDKDHIDVFIGDNPEADTVYVVNQVDPSTGKFDEHKVMVGFTDESSAKSGYLENYDKNWKGLGSIDSMPIDEFKTWLEGDTTKPTKAIEKPKEKAPGKRIISQEAFDKAQASLKDKLSGLKAGIDPTVIKELATIGAYHIESGIRNFKAWSDKMVSDYGDKIRPYIKQVWGESNKLISGKLIREAKEPELTPEKIDKAVTAARKETRIKESIKSDVRIDKIKTSKDILDRRRSMIRSIQSQFNLSDANLQEITRRDIRLMNNYEFKQFLDDVKIKAVELEEKLNAKAQLMATIEELQLKKWQNLQKAYKLPSISKMTTEQLQELENVLSEYVEGDEFLSQRILEMVDRTELKGIKTIREARAALAKETGIEISNLESIQTKEMDRLSYDTALAQKNPFYNLLVTDTIKHDLQAATNYLEVEARVTPLAKASRKSRKRGVSDVLIPQDKGVFEYIEASPERKSELAKHMSTEDLDLASYILSKGAEALEHHIMEGTLKNVRFKDAYIVHIRKGMLEEIKDSGLREALKGLFTRYEQDAQVANILDSSTGEILPLEKYFKFSAFRTGELQPSTNVAKSFLIYWQAFEKKRALDQLITKMAIYVRALEIEKKTPRGLTFDLSLDKFFKEWMNTKKGRHTKLIAKQGGKLDISLRAVGVAVTMKDLALNIPVGLASNVGEMSMNYIMLGKKANFLGVVRKNTAKGKAITEKYKNFIGKGVWEEMTEASKDIGDQLSELMFALFRYGTTSSNKTYLLGSLTKEEYLSGEISPQRLAEMKKEMGEYRHVEGSGSIIGATPEGKIFTKYKTWAVPPLTTTHSNLKKLINKKIGPKEAWQLYRSIEITTAVLLAGSLISSDDRDFLGTLRRKLYREALSILGATNPKFWLSTPRVWSWLQGITDAIGQILQFEKYKTKDEIKGVSKLKRELVPRAITQFDTKEDSVKSLASQYIKAKSKDDKESVAEIVKEIDDINAEREIFFKEKYSERLASMSEHEQKKFLEEKEIDIEDRANDIIQDELRSEYRIEGTITDKFNIKKMAAMPTEDFKRLRDTYSDRTKRKLNAKVGAWHGTFKGAINPAESKADKKNKVRDFFIRK